MRIWLDTTSLRPSESPGDDCECDMGDDCGLYSFRSPLSSIEELSDDLEWRTLQLTPSLYFQPCQDDGWLVCHPTGTGQVVVLDPHALAVLEHFQTRTTLHDVLQRQESSAGQAISKLVALFYRSGFLQDPQHPSAEHDPDDSSDTLSAWLHVTNACNLRCDYCYLDKTSQHMNSETARRSVDALLRSASRHHYRKVKLKYAGGEASLYPASVFAIHDYATEEANNSGLSLGAHIHSNGVFFSQHTIDQLKSRRIGVTISLDGVGDAHDRQRPFINGRGSFQYVDRTITRLLTNGITPHITVTVSQRNLDDLPDLLHYILEHDLSFSLSYYRDNHCSEHLQDLQFSNEQMIAGMRAAYACIEQHLPRRRLLSSLIDKAKLSAPHRHTCGVGHNYLVIDQDGGVAKCQAAIGQKVTTIHSDDPLQQIRDDQQGVQGLSVDEKEGCQTCQWRYWCGGGCPLLTYRLTGRYDVKSPNCSIYKALFPEALRLEGLRLLKYESPVAL